MRFASKMEWRSMMVAAVVVESRGAVRKEMAWATVTERLVDDMVSGGRLEVEVCIE